MNTLRSKLWHVPILTITAVASIALFPMAHVFVGQATPILIRMFFELLLVFHAIAFAIGMAIRRPSVMATFAVALIALIPIILFAQHKARNEYYHAYHAAADRFRDNLASPIPDSVADISFVPREQRGEDAGMMLSFSISEDDLQRIIDTRGFQPINQSQFYLPNDLFAKDDFLSLGGSESYFEKFDRYGRFVHTLKVSANRRNVIYRKSSAGSAGYFRSDANGETYFRYE